MSVGRDEKLPSQHTSRRLHAVRDVVADALGGRHVLRGTIDREVLSFDRRKV